MEISMINAAANLSAVGVLAAIAIWVMKRVPEHFQGLQAERANREQANVLAAAENRAAVQSLIGAFEKQATYERETCERRHQELKAGSDKNHEEVMAGITELLRRASENSHEFRSIAQVLSNDRALKEVRQRPQKGGAS